MRIEGKGKRWGEKGRENKKKRDISKESGAKKISTCLSSNIDDSTPQKKRMIGKIRVINV